MPVIKRECLLQRESSCRIRPAMAKPSRLHGEGCRTSPGRPRWRRPGAWACAATIVDLRWRRRSLEFRFVCWCLLVSHLDREKEREGLENPTSCPLQGGRESDCRFSWPLPADCRLPFHHLHQLLHRQRQSSGWVWLADVRSRYQLRRGPTVLDRMQCNWVGGLA